MRTHYCAELSAALIGQRVTLAGWAHRRRDHGGVIFIDLRDREGLAQVVCDPDRAEAFSAADRVRSEFVLRVTGRVRARPEGTANANLASGMVEVLAETVEILNPSATPPFQLDEENLSEAVRLEHRVLDLRRAPMQRNLRLRHRAASAARAFLDAHGFIDIETPVLYKSTPEGAREFLVPSRLHNGHFYALPQSPQLFKQMLMIAGFDRYYQIVKCFRDEDLRADRQPEFTQIDVETSFLGEEAIRALMEQLARHIFKSVLAVELPDPFPVLRYEEVMRDYGVDKPDLRVPLKLTELTDVMQDVDFKVFSAPANAADGRVAGPARARRRRAVARRDRRLHGVREDARREGPRLDQGERARQGRRRPAVADREEPARQGARRRPRAQRRAGWRHPVLRRRQVGRRECLHRRLAATHRPRSRFCAEGLAPAVGGGLPDVRVRRGFPAVEGAASPLHQSQRRARAVPRVRAGEGLRQGLRHGAERLGGGGRIRAHPPSGSPAAGVPRPEVVA